MLVVAPAAAQTVGVDQHGRFIAAGLDRVTVALSGFSPEAEAATQIEVQTWLASGYSNGSTRDFTDPGWPDNPPRVAAGCDGVTLTQLGDFELKQTETGRLAAAALEAATSGPVECPIRASAQDFEAETTLSVASVVPALQAVGSLLLALALARRLARCP